MTELNKSELKKKFYKLVFGLLARMLVFMMIAAFIITWMVILCRSIIKYFHPELIGDC